MKPLDMISIISLAVESVWWSIKLVMVIVWYWKCDRQLCKTDVPSFCICSNGYPCDNDVIIVIIPTDKARIYLNDVSVYGGWDQPTEFWLKNKCMEVCLSGKRHVLLDWRSVCGRAIMATSHYLSQCSSRSMSPYGVTRLYLSHIHEGHFTYNEAAILLYIYVLPWKRCLLIL